MFNADEHEVISVLGVSVTMVCPNVLDSCGALVTALTLLPYSKVTL